ncbi:MAG: radical SAM protein [Oscillospiraceae bacterium]
MWAFPSATRCAYCSFVSQSVEKSMKLIPPSRSERRSPRLPRRSTPWAARRVRLHGRRHTDDALLDSSLTWLCSVLGDELTSALCVNTLLEAGPPDTISAAKPRVLRAHGVDRVSVNPQTMSDRVLELIGRRHTASDIERALQLVREVGGFDVNMDLIAGLPGDSTEGFRDTVEKVLALGAENITVHTLSLKKGSRITLEEVPIPGADEVAAMLDFAGERLSAARLLAILSLPAEVHVRRL